MFFLPRARSLQIRWNCSIDNRPVAQNEAIIYRVKDIYIYIYIFIYIYICIWRGGGGVVVIYIEYIDMIYITNLI